MDRDEVIEEIEDFLDNAEINGVEDFDIDNSYDSITVVSIE